MPFSRLRVTRYKDKSKDEMCVLLATKKQNRGVYDFGQPYSTSSKKNSSNNNNKNKKPKQPSKKPQCNLRLMNLIFDDEFAHKFTTIGGVASRDDLDINELPEDVFWKELQKRFVDASPNEKINKIIHPHFCFEGRTTDMTEIVNHQPKKLREMYKELTKYYKNLSSLKMICCFTDFFFLSFIN